MNKINILIICLCAGWFFPGSALAQQMVLGGNVQLSNDQRLMFDAAGKVMKRDYRGAEGIYDQVIAMNGGNIDAYLQRGSVRRELGNDPCAMSDGQMAVNLADASLRANANNPNLYYQRGMGFRLLKNYAQAKQDIATGIKLGGPQSWQTDIQAIELERRAAQ